MREDLKQLSRYEQLVTRVKQIDIDYKSIVVSYVKYFVTYTIKQKMKNKIWY